jgi:hypothetical protein
MGINNKSNLRLKKKTNQTKICPLVLPFLPTLTKILTLFINPNQRHRVIYLEKKKKKNKDKISTSKWVLLLNYLLSYL